MTPPAAYQVTIKRSAERDLDRLDPTVFERAVRSILGLETNPRPQGVIKLRGAEIHRLRVGSYRVLYTIDDRARAVDIVAVGHRREVYRDR